MAQIIRASHLGFCFGVRDAIQSASQITNPEQTTVYGDLVHNQDVIASLRDRKFQLLSEVDRETVPERPLVMITAHGISQKRRAALQESGKQIIDTTCPLVLRVHDAANSLAERGYFVVVIGSPRHVEVLGITEDLPRGRFAVVSDPAEASRYQADQIGIVSQTTMPVEVAERCRDRITSLNPTASIRWINTICRPTRQRQNAIESLCGQVTLVIVVGGRNSNNTRRLVDRCEALGCTAHHVQSADDIAADWLVGVSRIGLTAGTSTPDHTIDAVEQRLRELAVEKLHLRSSSYASWTNRQWVDYFIKNRADVAAIPWSDRPTLTGAERLAVASSVQTFQLGESGEGKHILCCAENWVRGGGDPNYLDALRLFLQEENQHAAYLGTFLKQEQIPLLEKQWSDRCFRFLRHLAGLRTSISVLVTAEILAQVYYLALLRATDSATLKTICSRILRDERAHVVFQQSQKSFLAGRWSRPRRWLVSGLEKFLFLIARRIVWHDHKGVFLAAGMNWQRYRDRTTRRWQAAQRKSLAFQRTLRKESS